MGTSRALSITLLALSTTALIACGDDASTTSSDSTSSSSGGAGQGGAGQGGATGSGGNGTGAGPSCSMMTELTGTIDVQAPNSWIGTVNPNLGAGAADVLVMFVPPGGTGSIALDPVADRDDCSVSATCVDLGEDVSGTGPARRYRQFRGSLELGSSSPPYFISGSLDDVTLVEATLGADGVWTDVTDGACVHIASLPFDIQPPVAGWQCAPFTYDEIGNGMNAFCDCGCGAIDPDCGTTGLVVRGCMMGQACAAGVCQ